MTAKTPYYLVMLGLALFGQCFGNNALAESADSSVGLSKSVLPPAKLAPKARSRHSKAAAAARAKAAAESKAPPPLAPWAAVDPNRAVSTPADQQPPAPKETRSAAEIAAERLRNAKSDLSMQWRGNNDTPTQTRVQNLDGNAQGTGAEVGMKLHF